MAPKRKRTGTETSRQSAPSSSRPSSSRDATAHDLKTEAISTEAVAHDADAPSDPPAKRTRAQRSGSTATNNSAKRPGSASMPLNTFTYGGGEHGEAGKMRMEAPPPAGSVEPAGYHTNAPPKGRPVRVYADGVFDLFHLGHMRQLQQAKTAFPDVHLIVGVTGDVETHTRKGLTVMSAKERAESLRHCRWVDEVIEDCPWIITMDFVERHAIDFVAHDDIPYGASEGDDIYVPIKKRGMFLVTQRTEGVSTTGIITKIVRDYEQYLSRQLKRGTSRQELNISWLKKNELDIKRHVADLRDTIRTNWTATGQELSRDLKQFWQVSRPSSPAPSLRNGTPGSGSNRRTGSVRSPFARSSTPQRGNKNLDFAAGYAMGLIGGVKGWMEGSKRRNLSDSRAPSPRGDEDDSAETSPDEGPSRGRLQESVEDCLRAQLNEGHGEL